MIDFQPLKPEDRQRYSPYLLDGRERGCEYSFANLEGTLGDKGFAQNKKYVFRGKAEYTNILTGNGVEGVTLANNHSLDYGQDGYDETKVILDNAELDYVEHAGTTLVTTKNGLVIGMYAVDFTRGTPKEADVRENISALREQGAQLVICAFHWGQENTFRTIPNQTNYGHLAIDSGADIVWGHHPHVLQPMESYNGGLIMYSLGNFVFGGNSAPKDYDTAIVQQEVILDVDGTVKLGEVTITPCSVSSSRPNNYQPTPYEAGSKEYNRVLSKLDGSYTGGNLPIG